jgi:hypothetical protein
MGLRILGRVQPNRRIRRIRVWFNTSTRDTPVHLVPPHPILHIRQVPSPPIRSPCTTQTNNLAESIASRTTAKGRLPIILKPLNNNITFQMGIINLEPSQVGFLVIRTLALTHKIAMIVGEHLGYPHLGDDDLPFVIVFVSNFYGHYTR